MLWRRLSLNLSPKFENQDNIGIILEKTRKEIDTEEEEEEKDF